MKRFPLMILILEMLCVTLVCSAAFASRQTRTAVAQNTAPPAATLVVSRSGRGPMYFEGAIPYFEVSSSSTRSQQKRLEGSYRGMLMPPGPDVSASFSIAPGDHELRSYVRPCDGNCNRLGGSRDECRATFTIKAGDTLYAVRVETGQGACTLNFSSTPPSAIQPPPDRK